jgi:PIN domain nuclease of toxin-antitoxin system
VKYIVDTHVLLWFLFEPKKLSKKVDRLMSENLQAVAISTVSLWEIAIKAQIGKLKLGLSTDAFFRDFIQSREVDLLAVVAHDVSAYATLPLHHRDPFDRMLIAQAASRDAAIVTKDHHFAQYDIRCYW